MRPLPPLLLLLLLPAPHAAATEGDGGGLASLTVEIVVDGLVDPTFVTSHPTDATRLFVCEQGGRILLVQDDALQPTPYLDLTAQTTSTGEEGLLTVAFHPEFDANGHLYVYYNDLAGDSVLARFTASPPGADVVDPATEVELLKLDQPGSKHNGGTLGFGADGLLYLSTGDGGVTDDPANDPQALDNLFGKMLRLDVDGGSPYAIPPDNPFVGVTGAREEVWALGFRNPWRGGIDPVSGAVFVGDVGKSQREEVDHVVAGANFGWPCAEGTLCTGEPGCACPDPGYDDPIHVYDHNVGCAVIGGPTYRGSDLAGFDGRVFFADFCVGKVWSFAWDGAALSDLVDHTSELTASVPLGLITSMGQDADGEVYLLGSFPGRLFRIVPSDPLPDCDGDGTPDADELAAGTEFDVNGNGIPDSCELLLTATDFVPLQTATLDFIGAQPGDPIAFLWSTRGIGEGPCFFDGAWCLSLKPMSGNPEIGVLGVTIADAQGTSSPSFVVPDFPVPAEVGMQAVVILLEDSKLSNPIQKLVVPL